MGLLASVLSLERTERSRELKEIMLKSKRTLSYFEWDKIKKIDSSVLKSMNFSANASWALPQICAFLGSKVPLAKKDGKYNFNASVAKITELYKSGGTLHFEDGKECSANALFAILSLANFAPRGEIMPDNTTALKPEVLRFNASVPLVLSAFKQYRNIKYEDWNLKDTKFRELFLCKDFSELVDARDSSFDREDLLDLREKACIVRSTNSIKAPKAVTRVNRLGVPEFDELPRLAKLALLQLWVFLPEQVSEYSVNNPYDWDTKAEPLASSEVIKETTEINYSNPFLL